MFLRIQKLLQIHQLKSYQIGKIDVTVCPSFIGTDSYATKMMLVNKPMQLIHLYDKDGKYDEEYKREIAKELGDVLWYLAALCRKFDLKLEDIAQMNIDKLYSRKERGQIKGNGDNR